MSAYIGFLNYNNPEKGSGDDELTVGRAARAIAEMQGGGGRAASQIGAGSTGSGDCTFVCAIVSRYSRILRTGGSHSSPCASAIGGCDTPRPRMKRPSDSSARVYRAWAAMIASRA